MPNCVVCASMTLFHGGNKQLLLYFYVTFLYQKITQHIPLKNANIQVKLLPYIIVHTYLI